LKVITEAIIRAELKATKPEVYYIPEGKILSPAAREYLNQIKVNIEFEKNKGKREAPTHRSSGGGKYREGVMAKYTDYETGETYDKKPEHMTQLFDYVLVQKNHPRIKFRGKLDKAQALVVYSQSIIVNSEKNDGVLKDLDDILGILREMMRCEVLDEPFTLEEIIGFSHAELRERSHAPMKFYNVKYMLLPEYSMGTTYALLNLIRADIRELEVLAVDAFTRGDKIERTDVIEELNRMSSALHIMMMKYLSGEYNAK
jgi:ethanolamine utilization cobalamin adenosyltransferase